MIQWADMALPAFGQKKQWAVPAAVAGYVIRAVNIFLFLL